MSVSIRSQPGERLLGVIELVSKANKNRNACRGAFAAKMASYVLSGEGLVVVDAVTSSHFNLHNEFVELLGAGDGFRMEGDPSIYCSDYRPAAPCNEGQVDTWLYPLEVGEILPSVPFYLRGYGCIPLDLEASYTEARKRARL